MCLHCSRSMYERSDGCVRRHDRAGGPALAASPPRAKAAGPVEAGRGREAGRLGPACCSTRQAHTVSLHTPGMKLDVGGIAKGYAAQAALEVLKKAGVDAARWSPARAISRSARRRPAKQGWTIAIAPLEPGKPGRGAALLAPEQRGRFDRGRCRTVRDHRRPPLFAHHQSQDRPGRRRPRQRDGRCPRRRRPPMRSRRPSTSWAPSAA